MFDKFKGAVTHFYKVENAKTFFVPFWIIHTIGTFLITLLTLSILSDVLAVYAANIDILEAENGDPEASTAALMEVVAEIKKVFWPNVGAYLTATLFTSIMTISVQRHYVLGEKFTVNLSRNEFRAFSAALLVILLMSVAAFFVGLGGAIIGGVLSVVFPPAIFIIVIVCMGILAYILLRLSVIAPLIVRDNTFVFWRSIGETENKSAYLGASLCVYIGIYMVLSLMFSSFGPKVPDISALSTLIEVFLSSGIAAVFSYVFGGAVAYAVTVDGQNSN